MNRLGAVIQTAAIGKCTMETEACNRGNTPRKEPKEDLIVTRTERGRKGETCQEGNLNPEQDRAPREARLIPKGDHVATGTLDANESQE